MSVHLCPKHDDDDGDEQTDLFSLIGAGVVFVCCLGKKVGYKIAVCVENSIETRDFFVFFAANLAGGSFRPLTAARESKECATL